jgi:hypothetical protein
VVVGSVVAVVAGDVVVVVVDGSDDDVAGSDVAGVGATS